MLSAAAAAGIKVFFGMPLAIIGGLLIAANAPSAIVGLNLGENWLPVTFAPESVGGELIVALAVLGGASAIIARALGRDEVFGRPVVNIGHVALLVITAVTLVITAGLLGFIPDLYFTLFAAIPLGVAGAMYRHPAVPAPMYLAIAAYPLGVAVGLLDRESINPISLANIGWMTVVLTLQQKEIKNRALLGLIAGPGFWLWATTGQIGPRLAGTVAFLAVVYVRRDRHVEGGSRNASHRVALAAAVVVCALAVVALADELTSTQGNNSTFRLNILKQVAGSFSLVGEGIVRFEGEDGGREFAGAASHNFVADAVAGAGILGLIGILVVAVFLLRGFRRSRHPLIPYCAGVIVINLFSGGLFRSTSLWFALAFVMAEATRSRSTEGIATSETGQNFGEGRITPALPSIRYGLSRE